MEKDDRELGGARQVEGRAVQRALRPAPGKVTRTSKLSAGREPAAQRKAAGPVEARRPGPDASSTWTDDVHMDMAHRGLTALAERGAGAAAPVQRKASGQADAQAGAIPPHGSGRPMPEAVQARMERSLGADFSAVRIHEGPQAASLGALAYTQGTDIHFAPGQYDPGSGRGQELLGHELAHVVQQSEGRVAATTQARGVAVNDDQGLEREADEMGRKAAVGEVVAAAAPASRPAMAGSGPAQRRVVQRQQAPQGPQGAGSAAASAGAAVGAAAAAQPGTDELGTLLAALQGAADDAARQAATTALTTWCREHLVDRDRLRAYLQSSADGETKTRILGELRAEIARNEFLLGWSYEGGVTAGGENGWENAGANQGPFVDHYKDDVGTSAVGADPPWCTSFAGHTATRLGFEAAPGASGTSMFWSGYRLDRWARTGQDNAGTQVTPQDQSVAAEGNASAIITGAQWQTLYTTLDNLHQNRPAGQSDADHLAAQQQAVDAFLAEHTTPQAGDMFVYDASNAVHGSSHTNMVERYDAETRTIFTIGGNEDDAVGGRRVVLTDRQQVRRLASMVRIGAEFYTGLTGGGAAAGAPGSAATAPGQSATTAGAPGAAQQPAQGSQPAQVADGGTAVTAGAALVARASASAVAAAAAAAGAAGSSATQIGPALVQTARGINARIAAVLHGLGQIQSSDAGATVLEWQTGSTTANASTSDT